MLGPPLQAAERMADPSPGWVFHWQVQPTPCGKELEDTWQHFSVLSSSFAYSTSKYLNIHEQLGQAGQHGMCGCPGHPGRVPCDVQYLAWWGTVLQIQLCQDCGWRPADWFSLFSEQMQEESALIFRWTSCNKRTGLQQSPGDSHCTGTPRRSSRDASFSPFAPPDLWSDKLPPWGPWKKDCAYAQVSSLARITFRKSESCSF